MLEQCRKSLRPNKYYSVNVHLTNHKKLFFIVKDDPSLWDDLALFLANATAYERNAILKLTYPHSGVEEIIGASKILYFSIYSDIEETRMIPSQDWRHPSFEMWEAIPRVLHVVEDENYEDN